MKQLSSIAAAFSFLLLTGCAVGPNYKRPQVAVPNQWTVTPARGTSKTGPETAEWWSWFQAAELNSLIPRAVDANLVLRLALEPVKEPQAARGVARSGSSPPSTRRPQRLGIAKG